MYVFIDLALKMILKSNLQTIKLGWNLWKKMGMEWEGIQNWVRSFMVETQKLQNKEEVMGKTQKTG